MQSPSSSEEGLGVVAIRRIARGADFVLGEHHPPTPSSKEEGENV